MSDKQYTAVTSPPRGHHPGPLSINTLYEHALNQFIMPTLHELGIYRTDTRNLIHVSALHVCHPQKAFTAVKVIISKLSVVCSTVTHLHTSLKFVKTQEKPLIKC